MNYFIWCGIIAALFVANTNSITTTTKSEIPKSDALKPKREALVSSSSGNSANNYLSPSLKYLPPTPISVNNNQAGNHASHGSSAAGYGLSGASGGGFDFAQVGAPKIKTYIIQTQPGHGSAHNSVANAYSGAGHSAGAVYNSGAGYSGVAGHNGGQSYSNGAIYLGGAGYSSGGGHNSGATYSGAAGHNGVAVHSSGAGYSAGVGHNVGAAASGGALYNSGSVQSSNKVGYGGGGGYSGGGATHSSAGQSSSGGALYSSGAGHSSSGGSVHSSTGGGYSGVGGGYSSEAAHSSSGNSARYSGDSGGAYKRGQHYSSGASPYYGGSGYSGYKSNHKSLPYVKTFVIPASDLYKGESSGGHGGHLHLGPKIHVVGGYGGGGGHGHQHTASATGFGNAHAHVLNGVSHGGHGGHGGSNGAATLESYLGQGKDGAGTLESYLGGALVLGGLAHGGGQGGHGSNGGGGVTLSYANYAGFGGNDYAQSAHGNSLANYGIKADVTVTSDHGADGAADSYQNSGEDTPSYAVGHKGLGHFGFIASKPQALGNNLITLGKSGYAVYSGRAPFKPSTFLGNTHEASAETGSQYLPPTSAGYQYESASVLQGGHSASAGASHSASYLPPHQH